MNDNGEEDCTCCTCAVFRLMEQKFSGEPTTDKVLALFRAFSLVVGEVAKMSSDPLETAQVFVAILGKTLDEMQVATLEHYVQKEDPSLPPFSHRH